MTLAQPLPILRQELRETSITDLPTALLTLDELLPDGSEKKAVVTALRTALNQLNKDSYRGVIDQTAYALRLAQISANFIDLLDALVEADFESLKVSSNAPSGPKRGSVLYKIPRRMPFERSRSAPSAWPWTKKRSSTTSCSTTACAFVRAWKYPT